MKKGTKHKIEKGLILKLAVFVLVGGLCLSYLGVLNQQKSGVAVYAQSVDWWNNNWCQRRKLTFQNLDSNEDLFNFPILVKLDQSWFDYEHVRDAGQDLRFIDADNQTLLAYEIEQWDKLGDSYIWVKVPKIDKQSETDFIYMYYGNKKVGQSGQDPAGVWSDGFKMVQHLEETSGAHYDSTGNSVDLTGVEVSVQGGRELAKIGGADLIDREGGIDEIYGSSDDVSCDNLGDYTYEAWIYPTGQPGSSVSQYGTILSKGWSKKRWINYHDGTGMLAANEATIQGAQTAKPYSLKLDEWNYIIAKHSDTERVISLYVNGLELTETLIWMGEGDYLDESDDSIFIGNASIDGDESFLGYIDEVRISGVLRSDTWIEVQYKSMNDELVTYTEVETLPGCECVDPKDWWNLDWGYRRKLNLDLLDINEDMVDFPVLIRLTDSLIETRIDYTKVQDQGQDLRFLDADNQSVLMHDIEEWNELGDSYIWVRVPKIDKLSKEDFIYMYYGNPDAIIDGQNKQATWSNGYAGVWHLSEEPANGEQHFDVTAKANHGVFIDLNGSSDTSVDGKIAGADSFAGADGDRVFIGDPPDGSLDFGSDSFSYSLWTYVESSNVAWDTAWYKGGSSCLAGLVEDTLYWQYDLIPAGGQGDLGFQVQVE